MANTLLARRVSHVKAHRGKEQPWRVLFAGARVGVSSATVILVVYAPRILKLNRWECGYFMILVRRNFAGNATQVQQHLLNPLNMSDGESGGGNLENPSTKRDGRERNQLMVSAWLPD